MNTKHAFAVLLVLATSAFDVLAADLVPFEWSAEGQFAKELTVPASKLVEVCGKLPARTQVKWAFEAGGPLDFNIHYHEGKKVVFPARKNRAAKGSGTLKANVDQDYCWMWTNKGSTDLNMKLELKRAG